MARVSFDSPELVRHIQVNVTLRRYRQAMWRVYLAAKLIQFAAWIGGFGGVRVVMDKDYE